MEGNKHTDELASGLAELLKLRESGVKFSDLEDRISKAWSDFFEKQKNEYL